VLRQRLKAATRPVLEPVLRFGDRRIDHRVALAEQPVINDVKGMFIALDDKIGALDATSRRSSDLLRGQSDLVQGLADAVRALQVRYDELERRFTVAEENYDRYKSVVPSLLDAVSTQHSATRQMKRQEGVLWRSIAAIEERLTRMHELTDERLSRLDERSERVRSELFFELRHGGHDQGVVDTKIEPKIVNPEKVDRMLEDLRLNLGCGAYPADGYVNVDVRDIDGVVDVVADLGHLPFEPGSVAEVFSSHVLEHFPEEEMARRLLPYWVSLLRPDGVFRAIVPDAEAMLRSWGEGGLSFDDLRLVTFGGQEYDGDFHFTMFTVDSLAAQLRRAGLDDVEVLATGRPNGLCLELEVSARRSVPLDA
jgi:hypothetical protein